MKIKLFFATLFLLLSKCNAYSQPLPTLKTPTGWTSEKFTLPPAFAPGIAYKGVEEIAFSPFWNKKKVQGYWTYCYLWTLEGSPKFSKVAFENALRTYYTRLIATNLTLANIDTAYTTPVKVIINQLKTNSKTYEGKITMLDYMTQNPIMLNIRIKIESPNKAFFELSPLPFTNKYWVMMDEIYIK